MFFHQQTKKRLKNLKNFNVNRFYSNKSKYVLVGGDFNARTSDICEIVSNDYKDSDSIFSNINRNSNSYEILLRMGILKRASMDKGNTNRQGHENGEFCQTQKMYIPAELCLHTVT